MTSEELIRLSGLAGIIGGILHILATILDLLSHNTGGLTSDFAIPGMTLALISYILTALVLIGLYLFQSRTVGTFGFIGFVTAFVGQMLFLGNLFTSAFYQPVIARIVPEVVGVNLPILVIVFAISVCLMIIGYVLFGFASFKARILPRWGSLLLIVGAIFFMVPVVFGVALIWLGKALWSVQDEVKKPSVLA